jgi:putative PIN family toxin of toxin-antitoxin system
VKAVFDTNVLLAAFLTEGVCAKLFIRARKSQFSLITCPFILHEFERIITKKFTATKQERENAVALITEAAHDIVQPSGKLPGVCRDKGDDNVLACALEAAADYVVTGDKDLLVLKTFNPCDMESPGSRRGRNAVSRGRSRSLRAPSAPAGGGSTGIGIITPREFELLFDR